MRKKKVKTYYDTLMADGGKFRRGVEEEYQKLCLTNKKEILPSTKK